MAICARCKTQETQLYEMDAPVCLDCAGGRTKSKPPATEQQIRSVLLQDVFELTARTDEASKEFDEAMSQVSGGLPRPNGGVQRMKNASVKLSMARSELMKAHRRLDERSGIMPEDRKRNG